MEDDGYFFIFILQMGKDGPLLNLAGESFNPFMKGRIPCNTFPVHILIGNRSDVDHTVHLRLDHITGKFHRNHASIGVPPRIVIPQQVIALQHRNVQVFHKIFVVLAAEGQAYLKSVYHRVNNALAVFVKIFFHRSGKTRRFFRFVVAPQTIHRKGAKSLAFQRIHQFF